MIRVERGHTAAIDQLFYVDGTLTDATGAVTVTVTRADGTALATDAATTKPADTTGVYRYALAAQANLDRLTLTYSGTWGGAVQTETQTVEIVGDFMFTIAEARASDSALASPTDYPNAIIVATRQEVEDEFEGWTGVSWVRRYARDRVAGGNVATLLLPHWPVGVNAVTGLPAVYSVRSYSAADAYTAFTADELADLIVDGPYLRRFGGSTFALGNGNLVVEYEHGFDRVPADLKRAALTRLRYRLTANRSGIPDRALSYSSEGGSTFAIATPGMRGSKTGIPDVDAVLARYDHSVPAIA